MIIVKVISKVVHTQNSKVLFTSNVFFLIKTPRKSIILVFVSQSVLHI